MSQVGQMRYKYSLPVSFQTPPRPPTRRPPLTAVAVTWVLAFAALIVCVFAYRFTRHFVRSSDVVKILDQDVDVEWEKARVLPKGRGSLAEGMPLTNTPMPRSGGPRLAGTAIAWSSLYVTADGIRTVEFEPGPFVQFDQPLATRCVVNFLGTEVLWWRCQLQGALASTTGEYCFNLLCTGSGDAGYTVVCSGEYHPQARQLTLHVVERLWSDSARRCTLRFQLNLDGSVEYLGQSPTPFDGAGTHIPDRPA